MITEEPNATPGNEGASTLDRLERYLSAEDAPETQDQPGKGGNTETDSVDTDNGGKEQADQPQLTTSDLAKMLGVDENALDLDEDGAVKFKTKIDGAEGAAKLADVLKSYQLEGHVNKRSMELAEREKAQQAKAQEAEQQFSQRIQYAEGLANVAAQQLLQEYQSIDWKALEQQDAGTAALWRQKFQEKQAQLRGVYHNIQTEKANSQQKTDAETRQALQREADRLPQLIPEWKDAQVAAKERAELRDWAIKAGYEPAEVDGISKAHHVAVLRKAMLSDRLQSHKPEIENRVRTAPKLVKPGQGETQTTQEKSVRDLHATVRKTGGKNGSLEALLIAKGKV